MTKMIVETTGKFQLMGSQHSGSDRVPFHRPAVVAATSYIHNKASKGDVRVLKQDLPDSASDAEFSKHWDEAKGDKALAIESYVSTLGDEPATDEKPARSRRKPAE